MSNELNDILAWMKSNQLMLGLIVSAVIGTMPETLPALKMFPQWTWTWMRDASKTFLNYKQGVSTTHTVAPPSPPVPPHQLNG